jgi:hypothetical protein
MAITISGDSPNFSSASITTATITTLSDGTNSTSSSNVIQGSAKAWVNYKGTATQSIRASYNVSSVTRSSAGIYTINFTNAFADANYSIAGFSVYAANSAPAAITSAGSDFSPTTTACTLKCGNSTNGTAEDSPYFNAVFFR